MMIFVLYEKFLFKDQAYTIDIQADVFPGYFSNKTINILFTC